MNFCEAVDVGEIVGLFDGPEIAGFRVVDLPAGCTGWKCRHRSDAFSVIFLRFADGIEERYVCRGSADATLVPSPQLIRTTRRGTPMATDSIR